MGYNNNAIQVLRQAEDLKINVLRTQSKELLSNSKLWTNQQKLQSIYHQVLILDLEYALDKKVEQDLWNIGFKNHINILQESVRDKKNPQRSDFQALLNWTLESASGFYITLLQEVCEKFGLDFSFRRHRKIYGQNSENEKIDLKENYSCLYICQYCLVHLGDISRYRGQRKQAASFYKQAIEVSPNSGHPYNQLALLEVSLGDKLSTAFYYVRGASVKNPFPASTTNLLSILNSAEMDISLEKSKMSSNEFISLFLRVHGFLYTFTELDNAKKIVKNLGNVLTALVATESFNEDKLIKMTIINLHVYDHVSGENLVEMTNEEKLVRGLVLDLIASFLSAFLVPVHTLKPEENLDYYALPAIKIIFGWIKNIPEVLSESVFMKRLQIWPSFCKLLNNIQPFLKDFNCDNYSTLPLPEDVNLRGFLPMKRYLKQFDFEKTEKDEKLLKALRVKRILEFGNWLTDHEINGTRLIISTPTEETLKFEPGSMQPDPTDDLLEEIKSFSVTEISRSSGNEKKAGILKPQGSLEKSREEREIIAQETAITKQETAKMRRAKQNVALQSIFKKMEENKQVKFSVEEGNKDNKLVKFDQKHITNTFNQFDSPVINQSAQSSNQNHQQHPFNQTTSTPIQNQDYLTTLRNMANNYGMMGGMGPTGYPPQTAPFGWGGNAGNNQPKTSFTPANMGQPTFNQLQATGFDGNATANWWNNQGAGPRNFVNPAAPNFSNFNPAPPQQFGSGMNGMMGGQNRASGDAFNSPWNYGNGNQGNVSMRQQMLKETDNMPGNVADKFVHNHQNNSSGSSGYSLFNANSWNPNLTGHHRNPVRTATENAFGSLQQSSLFASQQGPQSLAQLLEQQNKMQHNNDFH